MEDQIIETERLVLRMFTQETLDELFKQPDLFIKNYLGLESDEELVIEKERYVAGYKTFNKSFVWFYILFKDSKNVVGWCGYHTWYIHHNRAEIGYGLISDEFKNQGIMSEAIVPIINYGFDEMKLHRIEAFVGPDNKASLHLIRKMGFNEEGRLKEHYYTNDRYEDSVVFGLLSQDWRN